MKFPGSNILEVDNNGRILLSKAQWKWFLTFIKCKAKTVAGQRKAIKKCIQESIVKIGNN